MTDDATLKNMEGNLITGQGSSSALEMTCQVGHSLTEDRNPEWVNNLLEYFEFCDKEQRTVKEKDKDRQRDYFTLKCLLCKKKCENPPKANQDDSTSKKKKRNGKKNDKQAEDIKITGCNASSFARHLQRCHNGEHKQDIYENRRVGAYKKDYSSNQSTDNRESIEPSLIVARASSLENQIAQEKIVKYDQNGVRQKVFNKQVLDFITKTGLPFNLTETEGFRKFIYDLNPKLSCPSRRTVITNLTERYEKIVIHLKKMLQGLQPRTAHLVLDIWSSRQKVAVIGIQVRFIKNGKLNQYVLGFKQFVGSHDAASIKQKVQDLLLNTYGLTMTDFLTVTADNASAILCAFRDTFKPTTENGFDKESLPVNEDENTMTANSANLTSSIINLESQINTLDDSDETLLDVGNELDDLEYRFVNDVDINNAIDAVIAQWSLPSSDGTSIRRNSCLAHLLQLGIRDALKNKFVTNIIGKVNTIVTWFHKSNKQYMALRERTKLGLLKPCETRWNSTYYCLKRMCADITKVEENGESQKTETFAYIVNRVLEEAKVHTKKVPEGLSPSEIESVKIIILLLEPFAELTDDWQGDGVTSSKVILGLIDKIKDFDAVEIPDISDESEKLIEFKAELRRSVWQRFETNRDAGQKVSSGGGPDRHIVTCDVFNERNYILATLLDPRLKLLPFSAMFHTGITFRNGCCSRDRATETLNAEYEKEKDSSVVVVHDSSQDAASSHTNSPDISSSAVSSGPSLPKKRKRSIFERIEQQQVILSSQNKTTTEVIDYLSLPEIAVNENPLKFWHAHEDRFPILSSLAFKYLAMPASSASVERLFSVAGGIISARRASMTIETAEKVIFYREYLRQGLPG